MRPLTLLVTLCSVIAIAAGIAWAAYAYFLSEELSKAEGRLSLYRSTVVAELERFSHLTFVLSQGSFVIATAEGAATAPLNRRLAAFSDRAGLDAIYLIGPDGVTIAASNANDPDSFVGQDYGFRPYFRAAMSGQQGRFYGIGTTTGLPAISSPSRCAPPPAPSSVSSPSRSGCPIFRTAGGTWGSRCFWPMRTGSSFWPRTPVGCITRWRR